MNETTITTNNNAEVTPTKKARTTRLLPNSQHDLLTLADNALKKWSETSFLTLLWVTPDEFKKTVEDFRIFLNERVDVGSERGSQTQTLNNLDKKINQAVEEVKLAILVKFGKSQGKAYFSEFGITKQGNSLRLPTDRNMRLSALGLFTKAIKKYAIQIVVFETSFFERILPAYAEAFEATQKTDSTVAVSVSNKNDVRKQVEIVLSALNNLVKLNYPNTYEGELRAWGFQKEKY
jgi:hypothetical protein